MAANAAKPLSSARTRLRHFSGDVTGGILHGAEKAAIQLADHMFRDKQVHEALVANIKSAIKDKESLPDSKAFGKQLIVESLKDS